MREETKKLVEELEKEGIKFDLKEGECEEKADIIDFSIAGDLTNYDIRMAVIEGSITIVSWLINVIKEEKYGSLLETLNTLNYEHRFAKFYAVKNDEQEGYCVTAQIDSVYGDNYDSEETIGLIGFFLDIVEEAYPQIIKCIA